MAIDETPTYSFHYFEGNHQFEDEKGEPYGSFEVFYISQAEFEDSVRRFGDSIDHLEPGWYWVAGFPASMWDGEPEGPYKTSFAAYKMAMEHE